MDPNVQVAVATVIGTTITTLGVIAVAFINTRRGKTSEETPKDNNDVLELVQSLVRENARKEATITRLRKQVAALEAKLPKEDSDA